MGAHKFMQMNDMPLLAESYLEFNAQDLEFGFNESRRDRILRTFVRNAYYYHLNEIYSTLKNEYTDWDKPVQNPLSVRDATLEVSFFYIFFNFNRRFSTFHCHSHEYVSYYYPKYSLFWVRVKKYYFLELNKIFHS